MTAYEIPLSSTDQVFQIPLGGVTYQITSKWCAPANAWTLDIADANGVALVSGIPLVTGVDLLEQYQYLGIAGQLVAQTDGDTFAPPTQSNLGSAGRLYFVVSDTVTATPGPEIVSTTPLFTRGVQSFSPVLEALGGLTVSADTVAYFTGGVTAALTGFTAAGRAVAGAANAAAQRSALGLTIGTNVQAWDADLDALAALTGTNTIYYRSGAGAWTAVTVGALLSWTGGTLSITDAELTALAGLTSAANEVPYFTGSGTAALASFTASGRALVGLTGAADKIAYFTGAGAATTADFTAAGRSVVGAANDSAQRTAMGVAIGTNVQAYSAELGAVAALATTGFIQRTGAATYSATTPPGALIGIIQDQKTQNTSGGTFTSGAWQTRDLNTLVYDRNSVLSVASDQFSISAAGTYEIEWSAPAYSAGVHQSKLYNITSGTDVAHSMSAACAVSAYTVTNASGIARITIAAPTTFEIRHMCSATSATYGFGYPANFSTEIYTSVVIRQG
jgi:hypothetical protein